VNLRGRCVGPDDMSEKSAHPSRFEGLPALCGQEMILSFLRAVILFLAPMRSNGYVIRESRNCLVQAVANHSVRQHIQSGPCPF